MKRWKNLWGAAALVLLLTAVLSLPAMAANTPSELYIGGTQITGNGYWTTNSSGALSSGDESNYNVKVEGSEVTLRNAVIVGQPGAMFGLDLSKSLNGIYADGSITIKLEGDNSCGIISGATSIVDFRAISVTGDLTITGNGNLAAEGISDGIYAGGNISIENGACVGVSQRGLTYDLSYDNSLRYNGILCKGQFRMDNAFLYVHAYGFVYINPDMGIEMDAGVRANSADIANSKIFVDLSAGNLAIYTDHESTFTNSQVAFGSIQNLRFSNFTDMKNMSLDQVQWGDYLTIAEILPSEDVGYPVYALCRTIEGSGASFYNSDIRISNTDANAFHSININQSKVVASVTGALSIYRNVQNSDISVSAGTIWLTPAVMEESTVKVKGQLMLELNMLEKLDNVAIYGEEVELRDGSFGTVADGQSFLLEVESGLTEEQLAGCSGIFKIGNICLIQGNAVLNRDLTIPEGMTARVTPGSTLTITEAGSLTIQGTMTNEGTVTAPAAEYVTGTINGGTIDIPGYNALAGSLFSSDGLQTAGPAALCLVVGVVLGMILMWAIGKRKKGEKKA